MRRSRDDRPTKHRTMRRGWNPRPTSASVSERRPCTSVVKNHPLPSPALVPLTCHPQARKNEVACLNLLTSILRHRQTPLRNMNDETRHVYCTRSAIIVFRFSFDLANFQDKRHTLIRVRLRGLACAPRATLSLPYRVERPTAFAARSVCRFNSFLFLSRQTIRARIKFSLRFCEHYSIFRPRPQFPKSL